MVEELPKRIDFESGVYGIDHKTKGEYLGIVYAQTAGSGPTCYYEEGTKTYTLTSGDVDGVYVDGEYVIYELDIRTLKVPISELQETGRLAEVIEKNKDRIRVVSLELGIKHEVPPGVLHQPAGKGILRIEVDKGYFPEQVIETEEVDLSGFKGRKN